MLRPDSWEICAQRWPAQEGLGEREQEEKKKPPQNKSHGSWKARQRDMKAQGAEKHCGHLQCDESPVGSTYARTRAHTRVQAQTRKKQTAISPQLCCYKAIFFSKAAVREHGNLRLLAANKRGKRKTWLKKPRIIFWRFSLWKGLPLRAFQSSINQRQLLFFRWFTYQPLMWVKSSDLNPHVPSLCIKLPLKGFSLHIDFV